MNLHFREGRRVLEMSSGILLGGDATSFGAETVLLGASVDEGVEGKVGQEQTEEV